MSDEDKKPIGSPEAADSDKTGKKRKHEGTPAMDIPSTSQQATDLPPWVAGGSPIRFVAPDELLNMSVAMDNLALVHEIAVDPNFRVEDVVLNPIEHAVRENMYKAYWDLLREDLGKEPPSYEQAFKLLLEIKQEMLDSLLSERHVRLRAEVNLILNEENLRLQLRDNNLDVKAISLFILELLGRLCCPERDEMVERLRGEDGIVELISGIFRLIDTMKNDLTNFAISQNRRAVEDHSAKVEYETYIKYLEKFPEGSNLTKEWLRQAYLELFPRKDGEPTPKREKEDEHDDYMKITARAFVNLIRHVKDSTFPETLRIDEARFLSYAFKFLQCTLATSAVLVTCNVAGKEVAEAAGFKANLKEHLFALSNDLQQRGIQAIIDDFALQCVKDSKDEAVKLNLTVTAEQEESIKRQIVALTSESHPVRTLVYNRMSTFVEEILRNPAGPPHALGTGMSVIERDLCSITARVLRLASHNRKTFEKLYKKLIPEIAAEVDGTAPGQPQAASE